MTSPTPAAPGARVGHVRLVVLLAGGAIVGKVLGFGRELLMARTFGATLVADCFRGTVSAVLLPLGPLLNESTAAILIPMCRQWASEPTGARKLAEMSLALGATAAIVMLLVELFASWWVSVIVGGFSSEAQALARDFLRIMALMMPAAVVLNCLAAADIAHGQSRIAAVRAAVLNVFVAGGIVAYALTGTVGYLPWSFVLSFNVLALWSLRLLVQEGKIRFAGVSLGGIADAWLVFMRRLRPLLSQPLVEQLSGWSERSVASGLMVGTMASLDYARTLTESASLIVAQPVGMAVLSKGALPHETRTVLALSGAVLAVALPASLYLGLFAEEIVTVVFRRGAFDQTAVMLTSASLRGIAAGLWAATLGLVLLRLLNNAGRNGLAALLLAAAFLSNAAASLVTGHIAGPRGNGSELLGLGESARGIVLLAGVAIALKVVWPLTRMLAMCLLPLAAMVVVEVWIAGAVETPVLRLAAGGIVAAMTVAVLAAVMLPEARQLALGRMRSRSRGSSTLPP